MKLSKIQKTLGAISLILAAGIAGTVLFVLGVLQQEESTKPIKLIGLTPEIAQDIQNSYTSFTVPKNESASVSSEIATANALADGGLAEGGARALETVLARYVNNGSEPKEDRLAWVVNLDPASVPWFGDEDEPVVFMIRVMDANTGEYLFDYGVRAP